MANRVPKKRSTFVRTRVHSRRRFEEIHRPKFVLHAGSPVKRCTSVDPARPQNNGEWPGLATRTRGSLLQRVEFGLEAGDLGVETFEGGVGA